MLFTSYIWFRFVFLSPILFVRVIVVSLHITVNVIPVARTKAVAFPLLFLSILFIVSSTLYISAPLTSIIFPASIAVSATKCSLLIILAPKSFSLLRSFCPLA